MDAEGKIDVTNLNLQAKVCGVCNDRALGNFTTLILIPESVWLSASLYLLA